MARRVAVPILIAGRRQPWRPLVVAATPCWPILPRPPRRCSGRLAGRGRSTRIRAAGVLPGGRSTGRRERRRLTRGREAAARRQQRHGRARRSVRRRRSGCRRRDRAGPASRTDCRHHCGPGPGWRTRWFWTGIGSDGSCKRSDHPADEPPRYAAGGFRLEMRWLPRRVPERWELGNKRDLWYKGS